MRPANVVKPRTEDEIWDYLKRPPDGGHVKVVGSRHSCSDLVRMEGDVTLLSLEKLPVQEPEIDLSSMTVRVAAATSLDYLNRYLWKRGFALENLGDVDKQTVAGAISTGTHGSGSRIGSLSSLVTHVRIVTPSKGPIDCAPNDPDTCKYFPAVRLSLGCLGVITYVTMKIQYRYWLRMKTTKEARSEVMAHLDELTSRYRHVECWVWPHTCFVSLRVGEISDKPSERGALARFWKHIVLENGVLWCVSAICRRWQESCDDVSMLSATLLRDDEIDASFRALATTRLVKYLEMEYVVPERDGPICLEAIMENLIQQNLPVSFPVHFRCTASDDIYLSPFYQRTGVSISVQQFDKMEYMKYFKESEEIFLRHDGRPHWGKLHFQNAQSLRSIYPQWRKFLDVRENLDPAGVFLTPYLRDLLGD